MTEVLERATVGELHRPRGTAKTLPVLNTAILPTTHAKLTRLAQFWGVSLGAALDRLLGEVEIGADGEPSGIDDGWATKYLEERLELSA